jgi:hypothetical protein
MFPFHPIYQTRPRFHVPVFTLEVCFFAGDAAVFFVRYSKDPFSAISGIRRGDEGEALGEAATLWIW